MKTHLQIYLLEIFLVFFLALGCSPLSAKSPEEIISKYKKAIVMVDMSDGHCTGFAVADEIIITAAHCFNGPDPRATVIADDGSKFPANLLAINSKTDVAILFARGFGGVYFELWDEAIDGEIPQGLPIMSLGYPGYYQSRFTFEVSYVKSLILVGGEQQIMAKDLIYPGESGGPVVSLTNGKVIGLSSAILAQTNMLSNGRTYGYTIGIASSSTSILRLMSHAASPNYHLGLVAPIYGL